MEWIDFMTLTAVFMVASTLLTITGDRYPKMVDYIILSLAILVIIYIALLRSGLLGHKTGLFIDNGTISAEVVTR